MKKLGEIGIGDIPFIKREELFKIHLPLSKELCEAVKETPYMGEENIAKKIAVNLFTSGGDVFLSEEANEIYGHHQVTLCFDYMKHFYQSKAIENGEKMAVIGWLADNIFDLEKMKLEENNLEE